MPVVSTSAPATEASTAASLRLPSSGEAAMAVGPSMAAAVAAAEERWSAERARLEIEIAELRAGRARDAEALAQNGALVSMLQETHAALIASNEQLIGEAREVAARHELEAAEFQRNFDELAAEIARMRAAAEGAPTAQHANVPKATAGAAKAAGAARAAGANAVGGGAAAVLAKSKVAAAAGVGGGGRRAAVASKGKEN